MNGIMKRNGILVLAVLVTGLGTLAGTAQARSVVAQRVLQSRQQVLAYWTAERMRSAKPVERSKPGSGGSTTTTTSYPFTSSAVPTPYTAFPTDTNGKVFFTDSGVNYVCSGTALLSGNQSVVWTAGHCVNQGPGSFHTNWAFVPAYQDGLRPYGTFTARSLLTTSQWRTAGDFGYDEGAAVVDPVAGKTLSTTVGGGRNAVFNYARDQQYQAYGYPAAKKFTGGRLWVCNARWGLDDTSASPATMGIGCDMTGGSSGGGWISGNDLYSINSYGYSSVRNVMFGPYQGSVAQSLYTTAGGS
jgi:hypothetical protein